MSEATKDDDPRFTVRATSESHFSWMRTRMSVERTLLSWVRSATALIGFGFTIVQFFEHLESTARETAALPGGPRYLGLSLMASGTLAMIVALWQYLGAVRYLRSPEFAPIADTRSTLTKTPIVGVAVLIMLVGAFAFVAVLLRLP